MHYIYPSNPVDTGRAEELRFECKPKTALAFLRLIASLPANTVAIATVADSSIDPWLYGVWSLLLQRGALRCIQPQIIYHACG